VRNPDNPQMLKAPEDSPDPRLLNIIFFITLYFYYLPNILT
jgi:hypothetical protein